MLFVIGYLEKSHLFYNLALRVIKDDMLSFTDFTYCILILVLLPFAQEQKGKGIVSVTVAQSASLNPPTTLSKRKLS